MIANLYKINYLEIKYKIFYILFEICQKTIKINKIEYSRNFKIKLLKII
jgi:hypothetical protein